MDKTDKIKISAFEYAIRTVAEPETLDNYIPETESERIEKFKKKTESFFKKIRYKK